MKRYIIKLISLPPGSKRLILIASIAVLLINCKKLVEIDNLTDKQLSSQVFSTDQSANSAMNGIYVTTKALNTFMMGYSSLSSDDLKYTSTEANTDRYFKNQLTPITTSPWNTFYNLIYAANSAVKGLTASTTMTEKAKQYHLGEAKYNRAFFYFYLVNLFGDVPLVLSTEPSVTATMARTPIAQVYAQIIADLKDAQNSLGSDYSYTGGDRARANKWVATALLARVYLYQKDWTNAQAQANAVISSGQYSLLDSPTGIFEKNNKETILQFANNSTENNSIAVNFIATGIPLYVCTSSLVNSFEFGDQRKTTWIGSKVVSGTTYYYPLKFTNTLVTSIERFPVLRLAEQYFIRAEAKAMQNDFTGAIEDINLVRLKHGSLSTPLPTPSNQSAALDVILHERRVDLFTEGMHRWFDLKRTGNIDATMLLEKPTTWKTTASLYPLPQTELSRDFNLTQNPGY